MPKTGEGIPKTIKLGEVEYVLADHPALMELVQSGRKDEKDKLYSTISGLEASIKVLKDENKATGDLSQKDKDALKALQDELAVTKSDLEKAKKGDAGDDPDDKSKGGKPTGITAEQVQKIVEDSLKKQAEQFEKTLGGVRGDLDKKNVEDYRKEILEKNKGVIIEALLPEGLKSVEEVNKHLEKALETSKQYIRKEYKGTDGKSENLTLAEIEARELASKAPAPQPTYVPPAGGGYPPQPPTGSGDVSGKELIGKVKEMSPAEFAKHRETLRQEVRKIGYSEEK